MSDTPSTGMNDVVDSRWIRTKRLTGSISVRVTTGTRRQAMSILAVQPKTWDELKRDLAAAQARIAELELALDKYGDGVDWIQRAMQAEAE